MSRKRPQLCAAVRGKSSSFLDGRLSADGRRVVQQHLNNCSQCLAELQAIAKLSRATHNLPQHRMPPDMASRIRKGLASQRSEAIAELAAKRPPRTLSRSRTTMYAAAAVLIATAWATGYWMGQSNHAERTDATPQAAQLPRPLIDADSFRLASHNVLQDLAVAPSLPEHAQQPLIAAQLAFFDLPQRARPILRAASPSSIEHRLAVFVTDLDEALAMHASIDWMQWHRRAEQRGLLERHPRAPAQLASRQPNERANTIVDRFPAQLNPAERESLAELLLLKHDLLAGEVTTSLGLIEQWQNKPGETSAFALASGTASTRGLLEGGRPEDAKRMLRAMRTHMSMHSLKATTSKPGQGNTSKGQERLHKQAAEMMERMIRDLGIDTGESESDMPHAETPEGWPKK